MRIQFILISEGPSDEGLIPHLQKLCIDAGADEVVGAAPDYRRLPQPIGRTVADKIRATMLLEPQANLIFIHRDADGPQSEPRHREIGAAVAECGLAAAWVAVVPVRETEAWLLLDESAIRLVAGRPRGFAPLNLPLPGSVENVSRPKERLSDALVAASGLSGRRERRFRSQFPFQRKVLLLRLPVGGPLIRVPSWERLRGAVGRAVAGLRDASTAAGAA